MSSSAPPVGARSSHGSVSTGPDYILNPGAQQPRVHNHLVSERSRVTRASLRITKSQHAVTIPEVITLAIDPLARRQLGGVGLSRTPRNSVVLLGVGGHTLAARGTPN